MKIVLINPSYYAVYGNLKAPEHPPLGLAYIAAALEADHHSVRIIDVDAEKLEYEQITSVLRSERPGLVGITATTPVFFDAVKLAEISKRNTTAYTVIGGIHATLMPMECAQNGFIDFTVIGEGEFTLTELVRCLECSGDISLVKGLVYKKAGEIIQNEPRPAITRLDSVPLPARHLFRNQAYSYPDALFSPAFPIITSRGCPGNCTFCAARNLHGKVFRRRSAENVLDEIEILIKDYGAREIHIWDDNFITDPKRVFDFRDGILKRNIKVHFSFPNGIRADFITREILFALKECGTYSIAIGVESGNQNVLDSVRKGITLDQLESSFQLAKELGIETWGFFLLGLPGEDAETINDTIDFAIKLDPCIAKFHILKPYPKSDVYDQLRRDGLLFDTNYRNYGIHTRPVHRLPTVSGDELLAWQKKAYRRFYLRPTKILKSIARVKSFNRCKLNFLTGMSLVKSMFARDLK